MTADPNAEDVATHDRRIDEPGFPWRLAFAIVALLLVIVFMVENTQRVGIRFVGPMVHAPLIVALLIAAILGSLATVLFQHRVSRRR